MFGLCSIFASRRKLGVEADLDPVPLPFFEDDDERIAPPLVVNLTRWRRPLTTSSYLLPIVCEELGIQP
jgi:hypothetical protein